MVTHESASMRPRAISVMFAPSQVHAEANAVSYQPHQERTIDGCRSWQSRHAGEGVGVGMAAPIRTSPHDFDRKS